MRTRNFGLAVLTIVLAACSGPRTSEPAESASNAEANTGPSSGSEPQIDAALSTGDATVAMGATAADARFPEGGPAYPGARVMAFMTLESTREGKAPTIQITLETPDSLKMAAAFYRQSLADAGFIIADDLVNEAGGVLVGKRSEPDTQTMIQFAVANGKTVLIIAGDDIPPS